MPRGELGPGLEDRKDRMTIRARLRRSDQTGARRDIHAHFPYAPDLPASHHNSRSSAITRAKAWLAEQQRAMRFDGLPVGERLEDQTLADWLGRYITEAEEGVEQLRREGPRTKVPRHARKKAVAKELSVLRRWLLEFPKLVARSPDQVSRKHLEQAAEHLLNARRDEHGALITLKPVTVRRWLLTLSGVYNTAARDWGFTVENPVRGMSLPQATTAEEHEREGRLVTGDELERILAQIPEASPQTLACIRFLRWSGARRSEALRLDWRDVDLMSEIPVATFKGTKDARQRYRERTIPLHPKAVEALKEAMGDQPQPKEGRVFPLATDTPTQAWIRGKKRAGLDVRLHDLRHTRTTEVTAVLHPLEAKVITGHADLRMLDRYYHGEATALGRKLLEADARIAASVEKRRQVKAVVDLDGLSDAKRLKADLAIQLLREAGVELPEGLNPGG
jgi:integrase